VAALAFLRIQRQGLYSFSSHGQPKFTLHHGVEQKNNEVDEHERFDTMRGFEKHRCGFEDAL